MELKTIYLQLLTLSLLSGCANIIPSYKYKSSEVRKQTPTQVINEFKADSQRSELDTAIKSEVIVKKDVTFLADVRNKKVEFWINYFTTRNKAGLERFIKNGEKYKPIIEEIFSKYGLPLELYYVGIVESGYYNRARSHAGAVGPWQFIKGTARRYGLKVTKSIDERKNIYKSTQAAALYFQDLYNIFGSWELALAAYNAGEYGIIRRIRGANTRKYYELSRRKIIPKETRNYVPKVLAVKEIIENPKKYNITIEKPHHNIFEHTKAITIKNSVKVSTLAKKLKLEPGVLKALNHDILGHYIPYLGRKGFEVFIPNKSKISEKDLNQFLASIRQTKKTKKINKTLANTNLQIHTVRQNESLYSISKRYGLTVKKLKTVNRLQTSKIYVGQQIKLPTKQYTKALYSYVVRKGDNLSKIASMFNIRLKKIKSMNNLKKTIVFVGQKLKVPPHKNRFHIVKKGEFLGQIARVNNKSLSFLRKINNIEDHIYPGQRLIVNITMI